MVMAMTTMARPHRMERLTDASVVTSVVEIAGARHEVLPPRRSTAGGLFPKPIRRVAPP